MAAAYTAIELADKFGDDELAMAVLRNRHLEARALRASANSPDLGAIAGGVLALEHWLEETGFGKSATVADSPPRPAAH